MVYMDNLISRIKSNIIEEKLIKRGDSILLSLSAGKDSMLMLNLFLKIKDEFQLKLSIFHLNHLTRGVESDKDATFLSELAEKLSIPFYSPCLLLNS